ncbi:hypothetical protein M408DRAFT_326735 [Serendipita vermifera MAFF 305830]|uniref:Uncharacterized protein n=1 Tax=Serendipita vermifera MAFF 305830 TaxID=933852 RepID=A0A0C3BNQ0_SERVB|nr:hypothetical protein M408DRAFT_326735 [Serendipita vermifera MAFF 305830]
MDNFSWADSIRATIGTCLPCVAPNADSDDERDQGRAAGLASARDELERLLDEPISDEDAETVSLHSNVGRRAGKARKKKTPTRKSVRVFGIDLFGRRPALPNDDDDIQNHDEHARRPAGRPRAISTSNLDADAAPVDEAMLDFTARAQKRWAPTPTAEEIAAEELLERQRAEKELRKAQRRERKELKRLAEAGAFDHPEADEFEGFPGSGGAPGDGHDEFGPFVDVTSSNGASTSGNNHVSSDDKEDEDVDFGASAYTKKRRVADGEGSRSGSGSHSRSRSRTSASISADGSQSRTRSAAGTSGGQTKKSQTPTRPTHKAAQLSGSSAAKRSKSSVTSSSVTQSLPSPTLTPAADVRIHSQDFDGVPGGLINDQDRINAFNKPALPASGFPSAGFVSTGFGNFKRTTSGLSGNAGVALARRGD